MIDDIITDIMKAEGWDRYTNHPEDRGGPTKWGITLKTLQVFCGDPDLTAADVRAIPEEMARKIYRERYIEKPGFAHLNPLLLPLVVDCGVNHGTHRAAKWLQKAVGVGEDGIIGPITLAAVSEISPTATYLRICATRVRFYGAIVGRDKSQAKFISGWNNRAAKWLVDLADLLQDS